MTDSGLRAGVWITMARADGERDDAMIRVGIGGWNFPEWRGTFYPKGLPQARAVSFVWNFCNDRQKDALRFGRKWHTGFDLNKLTAGSSKELGLHAAPSTPCASSTRSRALKSSARSCAGGAKSRSAGCP